MNEETTREFIKNLPQIIGAIGIIMAAYWAYRAKVQSAQNAEKIAVVHEDVKVVHEDVNSKMQQLLETTAKAAHAEGKKEQLEEQNARKEL